MRMEVRPLIRLLQIRIKGLYEELKKANSTNSRIEVETLTLTLRDNELMLYACNIWLKSGVAPVMIKDPRKQPDIGCEFVDDSIEEKILSEIRDNPYLSFPTELSDNLP